jgi:dienelactone hydrolase
MSERPSPNVLVQVWLDSKPSWSTKKTNAMGSCAGAVVTNSTASPARTKIATVAYSSKAMSTGLRWLVLM